MAINTHIEGLPDRSHVFKQPNYRHFIRHYGQEYHVSCYEGDLQWIKDRLRMLPYNLAMGDVLSGYSQIFKDTYHNEPNEAAREGEARRAANIWIRHTINSHQ